MLVDDYQDVTVATLEANYARIIGKAKQWDFTRLTPGYWAGLVRHVIETGSSDIVQRQHPIPVGYGGDIVTPGYHPLSQISAVPGV